MDRWVSRLSESATFEVAESESAQTVVVAVEVMERWQVEGVVGVTEWCK